MDGAGRDYAVQRYRPRVEGLFSRIERWRDLSSGETHWRAITSGNVTTLYGASASSRIADPADPARVFSWLVCESYDDKGNYSRPVIGREVHDLDPRALENLPAGIDGTAYQWVDLDGEGLSGILARQGGAWFYRANLGNGQFAPERVLATQPALAATGQRQQLARPGDPRIVSEYAATDAIATSSGQNDSGMFELNFRDERYLPFEFAGAVSRWRIELPPENNFFDTDTVTDLVLP